MSSQRSVLVAGLVAVLLAAALIGATLASGILFTKNTTEISTTLPQISGLTSPTGTKQGSLAVLMTDPPTVPDGVSQVYINYTNLAIHVGNAPNDSGWANLNYSGSIDLMSIINVTQTIALANVSAGVFNGIAFNVSSALVTYQNANYSADLVYQNHYLVAWIAGGISIVQGQLSAAVIDLTPTILLLGTPTSPTFAFIPSARAYTIPAQSFAAGSLRVGNRMNIEGQQWWRDIENNAHFEIVGLELSPNSLNLTVTNTGNTSLVFQLAAVSATTSIQGGPFRSIGAMMAISEIFSIERNASINPITNFDVHSMYATSEGSGYVLSPHATVTFSYSGNITIGLLQPDEASNGNGHGDMKGQPPSQIISGQQYVITIRTVGGLIAESAIVAS